MRWRWHRGLKCAFDFEVHCEHVVRQRRWWANKRICPQSHVGCRVDHIRQQRQVLSQVQLELLYEVPSLRCALQPLWESDVRPRELRVEPAPHVHQSDELYIGRHSIVIEDLIYDYSIVIAVG